MSIPEPVNPLPWTQERDGGPVYDANGQLVSFVENGDFILWLTQLHHSNVTALVAIERIASASTSETDKTIALLARGRLQFKARVRR